MKGNRPIYTGNFLFALNVFVIFLLLFEGRLNVPQWLQPFGRMHPLILHFPIVLLLLSMVMEFFRFKTAYNTQGFYQNFTSNLLLVGVISSGVTVIMGLFLSQEDGYNSQTLAWHKWAGASVFFVASIIYTSRNSNWYKPLVAKAGAIVATLCLILAGHFGAVLTHGDNFIWQPVLVLEQPVVPLEEAIVFDHVIKPVFERKCIGCHNPEKLKGELLLTDSLSIIKGGKTGAFLVPGKPELSLVLKRIHLPLEDKKHMPPSGKAQLTAGEITLLHRWIKADALFSKKVIALPEDDTLRLLATAFLVPEASEEEIFDFPPADEGALERLNTNYRVVSLLAKKSPALTVNIYNREAYTPGTLEELKDVKDQIVSLVLSKMPVKNSDLKNIARFENLRKLNLNFTDISGAGLEALLPLTHLTSLSLSGTNINYSDLQRYLPLFRSLNTLAVWDTGISQDEIHQLRAAHRHIEFLAGFIDDGSRPIKLNPPSIKNRSVVFDETLALELVHPVRDVEIRFTTDGSDPDSLTSALFKGETTIQETTMIKARAYKDGWLSSDIASLNVYRSGHKPDSIMLLTRLNKVHVANGAKTFFDHELGSFNAVSFAWANNWAGFINNDMELLLEFKKPRMISSVALNMLVESESYIFPPASIEVWGGPSKDNLSVIARIKPEQPRVSRKPFIQLIDCSFETHEFSYLKLIAKPVMKLPFWHTKKDQPALLLVDEVLIN